jgi:uncharacterized protein (TIGR00730 family)
VFCGSRAGARPAYTQAARELGAALATRGLSLVYGGAKVGTMGALADAALAAGGEVIGVMPRGLVAREVAHPGLTAFHAVASMHERKALMADLADAFIALPGGYGTLDEVFEILTWAQLELHAKPVGLLDVEGFFEPLLAHLDRAVAEGFLAAGHRGLLLREATVAGMLDRIQAWEPAPAASKWDPGELGR